MIYCAPPEFETCFPLLEVSNWYIHKTLRITWKGEKKQNLSMCSQTANEWPKWELSVDIWLSCTLIWWLSFTDQGINYNTFLPLPCLPATKTPCCQKNKLNKKCSYFHTDILWHRYFWLMICFPSIWPLTWGFRNIVVWLWMRRGN